MCKDVVDFLQLNKGEILLFLFYLFILSLQNSCIVIIYWISNISRFALMCFLNYLFLSYIVSLKLSSYNQKFGFSIASICNSLFVI